mgnify:CR=1 FL=1
MPPWWKLFFGVAVLGQQVLSDVDSNETANTVPPIDDSDIVGGTLAQEPYPYFAHWTVGCGATLIHDDILLSAAHCSVGYGGSNQVSIGSLYRGE